VIRRSAFALAGAVLIVASATTASASRGASAPHASPFARATVHLQVPAANDAAPFNVLHALDIPDGWTAEVWARIAGARFELWTPENDLLVSEPGSGEVVELVPEKSAAAVPTTRVLISGLTFPQGMAFDVLGGRTVLYVAESDEVDRYVWRRNGTVGSRTVLVSGLPDETPGGDDVHREKEVVVGPNHTVYVDVGSGSNASAPNGNSVAPRASVMAYSPAGKGRVFATGIRNGDGLSFDPDGELWTAVNERDQIAYPFKRSYGGVADAFGTVITSYVNNHPPDELAKLTAGRNLGWPYCDPDPDVKKGALASKLRYANLSFDADAQTNPGDSKLDCAKLAPLQRGIPAHSAPLGFHFLEGTKLPAPWNGGAVVAVHGSWDRTPPRAPAVLWFPWEAAQQTLGNEVQLVTGFQNPDGSRWGRAVDAVAGPDGALYVSDDTAGAVYRIAPPK
jgi:glucose/arabinose dehydrogenase